jgi:hypothetical protein
MDTIQMRSPPVLNDSLSVLPDGIAGRFAPSFEKRASEE